MKNFNLPALGGGAGLRHAHFREILERKPRCGWFEIISEDFMGYGGREKEIIQEIGRTYRLIGHGVCMSIGSTDPLDREYLQSLGKFLRSLNVPWTSDHLCFTMVDHTNLNELIPLPFTQETVDHVVQRLRVIQDELQMPFLIENVTRYITVSDREMTEAEFICRILEGANCGLLLDVTNVYLNSVYHGFDPYAFVRALPADRIGQYHLAGSTIDGDGRFIDSHDAPVAPEVWELFQYAIRRGGRSSALIEWDNQLPSLDRLLEEAERAEVMMDQALQAPQIERGAAA